MTTLEQLEARVATLERELADLRQQVAGRQPQPDNPLAGYRADQAALSEAFAKLIDSLGITEQPIGAEQLQQRIAAGGVKPGDNILSSGIVEVREE